MRIHSFSDFLVNCDFFNAESSAACHPFDKFIADPVEPPPCSCRPGTFVFSWMRSIKFCISVWIPSCDISFDKYAIFGSCPLPVDFVSINAPFLTVELPFSSFGNSALCTHSNDCTHWTISFTLSDVTTFKASISEITRSKHPIRS